MQEASTLPSVPSAIPIGATAGPPEDAAVVKAKNLHQERAAHIEAFKHQTGMTPKCCYRVVLLAMALRIVAMTWFSMVVLEYTRYYIINDIGIITTLETITGSPQHLIKAFLFPFWGVFADNVSRKKVLVAASAAMTINFWLMATVPSVEVLVIVRSLNLVADVGSSIRNAQFRDLFSAADWERENGGATGIKSHVAIFGTIVTAFAVAVGMTLLKLGDVGLLGLENEYTLRKEDCRGNRHCVPRGQYSWYGTGWQLDGSLRLLMLMAAVTMTLETLVVVFVLPETIRQESRANVSVRRYIQQNWSHLLTPWNSLRVFATVQLRDLIRIRFIWYIIAAGGGTLFNTWYRRFEPDTFTMYALGVSTGVMGFGITCFVKQLVVRHGDLRGIWLPANVFMLAFALGTLFVPPGYFYLFYIIWPLTAGPGLALSGFTPELLSKLVPPDVQGTFQTAKSFLYDIQQAVMVWPYLGLFQISENLPHPADGLTTCCAIGLGLLSLWLIARQLPTDPQMSILQGQALEPYWHSSYVKSKWYRQHGGRMGSVKPDVAEGQSKTGLFLTSTEDSSFMEYLQFLTTELPRIRSLSVVLTFLDPADLQDLPSAPCVQDPPSSAMIPANVVPVSVPESMSNI